MVSKVFVLMPSHLVRQSHLLLKVGLNHHPINIMLYYKAYLQELCLPLKIKVMQLCSYVQIYPLKSEIGRASCGKECKYRRETEHAKGEEKSGEGDDTQDDTL